jgi:hypothetical protein
MSWTWFGLLKIATEAPSLTRQNWIAPFVSDEP